MAFFYKAILPSKEKKMDWRSKYTKHGALPIMLKDHCDQSPAISFYNILGKAIVFFLLPATEFLLGFCCVAIRLSFSNSIQHSAIGSPANCYCKHSNLSFFHCKEKSAEGTHSIKHIALCNFADYHCRQKAIKTLRSPRKILIRVRFEMTR